MKKPDRFERAVSKKTWDALNVRDPRNPKKGLWASEAVDLLRKEHRWVERLIKQAIASVENGVEPGAARNGYLMACNELLEQLKQHRK